MADFTEAIEASFTYHPPHGTQQARYEALREGFKALAHGIDRACPMSREKLQALDHLGIANMLANASISRNETEGE